MTNYEQKQELESIGLPTYPGCRVELVEQVMEEYGMPLSEILGKLSDDDIITAVHRSLELYGVEMSKDEDEE